jgi:hypothetical protein
MPISLFDKSSVFKPYPSAKESVAIMLLARSIAPLFPILQFDKFMLIMFGSKGSNACTASYPMSLFAKSKI